MARINEFTDLSLVFEILEVEGTLTRKSWNNRNIPLVFSISGHLGRSRKDMISIIEQAGGEFRATPSRMDCDYLITNNDWNKGSTKGKVSKKVAKAQRDGIKIISEQEFYDMLMPSENQNGNS